MKRLSLAVWPGMDGKRRSKQADREAAARTGAAVYAERVSSLDQSSKTNNDCRGITIEGIQVWVPFSLFMLMLVAD
ncbi:hypothetical protein [Paenibacillus physcomitrellae]|uniref:hypothetical protein n=1 Tax=Paenibacillus physcomitrellae TaxID=1619311 RepID=UPI000B8C77BB|nr:hypothetical protein [Paenibacillus physcomitrellae]